MPSTIIIILLLQLLLIIFSPPANGEKIVDLTIGKLPMDMVQIMLYPQGTFKWRDLTFQSLSQIISEYGCYCGRGKSGMPVDSVDRCCMNHDECYTKLFKLQHCANLLPPEKYAGRFLTKNGVYNCNSDNACMEQICSCDTAFIGCLMSGEDTPRQGGRQCVPVPPPLPPTTTQPITQPPPPPTQSPPPPTQPPAHPSPPAPTTETPASPPTPTSTTPVPLPPSPPTTVTSTPSPTTDKESRVETTSTSTSRSVQPETTSSSTDGSSTSIKDPAQTLKQQKTRWTQPVRDGKLFGFFGTGLTPLPPNLA